MQLCAAFSRPSANQPMWKSASANDQSPAIVGSRTQSRRSRAQVSQKPPGSSSDASYSRSYPAASTRACFAQPAGTGYSSWVIRLSLLAFLGA